jgi:sulfoacetaldehyde acetyltransferase
MRMGPSEALVEQLRAEGVTEVFGIVGSAFMDALDLFPAAGIRFIPVRHEQSAAHMADAFARLTGRPGVAIGQNGPGITNMVTSVAAAYLAHSPIVVITPGVTTASVGLDGFQETDQLAIFRAITRHQFQVNRPDRMAEAVRTAFRIALAERGPVQIDIPRDHFFGEVDVEILSPDRYRSDRRGPGDPELVERAARLLADARFPVIIAGMGVVDSGAVAETERLAERLGAPVVTSYLHNDAFPASHPLSAGPIGYCGSKAAMRLLAEADVVLALGTRLSAFGTLPQYGIDYFPTSAAIIQVDIDPRQLGRVKPIRVGIIGDARQTAGALLERLAKLPAPDGAAARREEVARQRAGWQAELEALSSSTASPISPRRALAELAAAMTEETIVSTDIGNIASVANSYLRFEQPRRFLPALSFGNCGFAYPAALGAQVARPEAPVVALVGDGAWGMSLHETMTAVEQELPVVAVVFNNGQWGAEKKNQVDYYDSRFVGTPIRTPDFAAVARAMGAEGIRLADPAEVRQALRAALASRRPTVLELMVDPGELAEPFRRDALRRPVRYLERYRQPAPVG